MWAVKTKVTAPLNHRRFNRLFKAEALKQHAASHQLVYHVTQVTFVLLVVFFILLVLPMALPNSHILSLARF